MSIVITKEYIANYIKNAQECNLHAKSINPVDFNRSLEFTVLHNVFDSFMKASMYHVKDKVNFNYVGYFALMFGIDAHILNNPEFPPINEEAESLFIREIRSSIFENINKGYFTISDEFNN